MGLQRIGFNERHRMDVLWPIEPKDTRRSFPGYRLGHLPARQQRGVPPGGLPRGVPHAGARGAARPRAGRLRDAGSRRWASRSATWRHARPPRSAATSRRRTSMRNEPLREPWCAHVVRRARGVIVHSRFRPALPRGARVPHAGLRGAPSRGGVAGGGARRRRPGRRAPRAARSRRRAHGGGGARGPQRGEATGRRPRGDAAARPVGPRRAGGPPHHRLRHRPRRGGGAARPPGDAGARRRRP